MLPNSFTSRIPKLDDPSIRVGASPDLPVFFIANLISVLSIRTMTLRLLMIALSSVIAFSLSSCCCLF